MVGATAVMCPVRTSTIQGFLSRFLPSSLFSEVSEFPHLWRYEEGRACPPPPHPFHCVTISTLNHKWYNRVWRQPYYIGEETAIHLTGLSGKLELLFPWVWSTCASCIEEYCRAWLIEEVN